MAEVDTVVLRSDAAHTDKQDGRDLSVQQNVCDWKSTALAWHQ